MFSQKLEVFPETWEFSRKLGSFRGNLKFSRKLEVFSETGSFLGNFQFLQKKVRACPALLFGLKLFLKSRQSKFLYFINFCGVGGAALRQRLLLGFLSGLMYNFPWVTF